MVDEIRRLLCLGLGLGLGSDVFGSKNRHHFPNESTFFSLPIGLFDSWVEKCNANQKGGSSSHFPPPFNVSTTSFNLTRISSLFQ
jgi:hypothetical protein